MKLSPLEMKLVFGGAGNGVLASCSTTCRDGSSCSVKHVDTCSTIANAGSGEECITYTRTDGTSDFKYCP